MTPGSYVVVFASTRRGGDGDGYAEMSAAAQEQERQGWYAEYAVTIARVERHYGKGD